MFCFGTTMMAYYPYGWSFQNDNPFNSATECLKDSFYHGNIKRVILSYDEEKTGWESRNLGFPGVLYFYYKEDRDSLYAIFVMNFGVRLGFKYQFWYLFAVWNWTSQLTSWGLSFFIYKMALVIHGFLLGAHCILCFYMTVLSRIFTIVIPLHKWDHGRQSRE